MKKAVMYGAGNIGRGFLGQLFFESGYHTVFLDINEAVIEALNRDKQYPLKLVSNAYQKELIIENVSAVNSMDSHAAALEIAACDIMCTAVGVNVLPKIIPVLAEGIRLRSESGRALNIIICENLIDANLYIKKLVLEYLPAEYHDFVENKVGFIEASVGRMVPVVTEETRGDNILRVMAEPFCTLPVDKDAFKGEIPEIKNIVPSSNFEYYIQSKLFLHNMGHATAAYLGKLNGYQYIYEAMNNDEIKDLIKKAMYTSAEVLSAEHGKKYTEVKAYANDLLNRFQNKYLGDTVERVGRDLHRKLCPNDRLLGAINLCKKHGVDSTYIKLGVAAAMLFGEEYDPKSLKI